MNSLTLFEHFTAQDWEKMSKSIGQLVPIVCFSTAFLSKMFSTYNLKWAIFTVVVGAFTALWELPLLFTVLPCIPNTDNLKERLLEKCRLKFHLARAALYALLSWPLWTSDTFCELGGLFLDISALLYVFAYINKRSDAADGIRETDTGEDEEAGSTLLQASRFGTF
jgi:hypothetical protein